MRNYKKSLRTLAVTVFSAALLAGALTGCAKSERFDKKAAEEAANGIFNAFAEQDADALDRYLPDTGLGSIVYNDPEGFQMYTSKMTWEIIDCEESRDGDQTVKVQMKIANVDMVHILEENPPLEGAQMPDPTPEQIAGTATKTFDYVLPLKKDESGYRMDIDSSDLETSMKKVSELMNVITGGGYEYLESLMVSEVPDESGR